MASVNRSAIGVPSVEDLSSIASRHGLGLSDQEVKELQEASRGFLEGFRRLGVLQEPVLAPTTPRLVGQAPLKSENPLGAWSWRTDIVASAEERTSSLLDGYTVALKDNVCLAGVPMSDGSRTLEGFVPTQDATLVTRILKAGGRIIGKTVCEDLCLSGGSFTSSPGPVHNPYSYNRNAGGSSSGSAAVVAMGDADMAIAGDQGGSIRIPACWCGVVGLKPTHGLVPYTGLVSLEPTIDHTGPIAKDAYKASLLLEAIAGRDGLDARQAIAGAPEPESLRGLAGSLPRQVEDARDLIRSIKFGVLAEGFDHPKISEPDVDSSIHSVIEAVLTRNGASVANISIPEHREAGAIWSLIGLEGIFLTQFRSGGQGLGVKGHFMPDLMRYMTRGLATRAENMSLTAKMFLLLGAYVHENYGGEFYGRGQNLSRLVTKAYDDALEKQCDILLMPTLPYKPPLLPNVEKVSIKEYVSTAVGMISNTAPFDVTGHPAVTVPATFLPCEDGAKVPVGLMMVGGRMKDAQLMRVARAFELLRGDLPAELAPECR